MISSYLRNWRINVTVCATAATAAETWSQALDAGRGFGAVIVDIKGLGAAGLELVRKIRADQRSPQAGIIALVAIDSFVADDSLDRLGVFATLTKPARPSELFNCLSALAGGERRRGMTPFPLWAGSTTRAQFDARVLVVEDNVVNQEVAIGMLEALGCRAVTASNGGQAVQLFAEGKFDLLLMDCEMPVMDGFEAVRRIRELERLVVDGASGGQRPRTPIIAITAHALAAVRERALAGGMDDFLVKPYSAPQLAEALRRWLRDRERAPVPRNAAPAPAPAKGADGPIDTAKIDEIRALKTGGGAALLQRVVSQFTAAAAPLAVTIRAKTGEGDADAVWRAAHSLKSSAAAVGAIRLSRHCAEIEAKARATGTEAVHQLLDVLDAELASATQGLQTLV